MELDLFTPGAYCRTAGGNLERPELQAPVVKWLAWSINVDNGAAGDPGVWTRCRGLWDGAGLAHFPWLHVRKLEDVDRLITTGLEASSPAIGLNLEDVVGDFTSKGITLERIATKLERWAGPIHMPTLGWVQNGQGWGALRRVVAALEIFPDEVPATAADVPGCVAHAFAEGLDRVTLMFKTGAPNRPADYDLRTCHSLYTADDITPTLEAWGHWIAPSPCAKLRPVSPPPTPTPTPTPSPLAPLTEKQVPYTGPYSRPGGAYRSKGPTAKALKIAAKRMGQAPFAGKDNASFDYVFNDELEAALDRLTMPSWDGYGHRRWVSVRGLVTSKREHALNKEARDLILEDYARMTQTALPDLGPLYAGGKSVLDHDLTHATDGLPLYPAFDDAFKAGTPILAPEELEVVRSSSSSPGAAFYAEGRTSRIAYWFGHLVSAPAVGKQFARGSRIGVVLDHSVGGGPHCHCGINVEALFGAGRELEHHTDYTHGAPTIRTQLERFLA